MAHIIGYTRKKRRRWPYIMIGSVILLALLIALLVISSKESERKEIIVSASPTTTLAVTTPTTGTTIADLKEERLSFLERFNKKKKVEKGIEVEKIIFSNGIDEYNQAMDSFVEMPIELVRRIYCYTKVNSPAIPQIVRHVWLAPDGTIVADIKLTISRQPSHTWSYVNLFGKPAGQWRVQVQDLNGQVLKEHSFLIYQ